MHTTHVTLLQRAGSGAQEAWSELDQMYRPFIQVWLRAQGVDPVDADDLTQDVLTVLFQELPQFEHSGRTGAFRTWLRTICLNRLLGHRRALAMHGRPTGGTEFQAQIQAIAEDDPLIADWDREHEQAVLRYLYTVIEPQFELETLAVFRRLTVDGHAAEAVAAEFGMTAGAVFVARSRVLRRLREEAQRFLGEDLSIVRIG